MAEVLKEVLSISGVARHYGVHIITAKNWIHDCGLDPVLYSTEHQALIRQIVEDRPKVARRARVDSDLRTRLRDVGERKLLARAIVDEFHICYTYKKNGRRKRHTLALQVLMYDEPPVKQVADLMGASYRMTLHRSKSGVRVPCWYCRVDGYRAYRIIELVRPYLVGQKAFQSDIALKEGPLPAGPVSLKKEVYRAALLSRIPEYWSQKLPASPLPDALRTSVA